MKKSLLIAPLVLLGLGFQPIQAQAQTSVRIQHLAYPNLSSAEQNQVVKAQPHGVKVGDKDLVNLVYQAKQATQVAISTQTSQEGITTTSGNQLPQTGEVSLPAIAIGIGFLGAGAYLIYKNKKAGKYLLVALVSSASLAGSLTASAEYLKIADDIYVTLAADHSVTVTPPTIDGYSYVGYFVAEDLQAPASETSMTQLEATSTLEQTSGQVNVTTSPLTTTSQSTSIPNQTETTTVNVPTTTEAVTTTEAPAETTTEVATTEAPVQTTTEVTTTEAPVETTTEVATTLAPVETTTEVVTTEAPVETTTEETTVATIGYVPDNIDAINQAFTEKINAFRTQQGLAPLAINSAYGPGMDTRGNEIATVFSHTRPDGSSYSTAFEGLLGSAQGENIATFTSSSLPTADAIAETLYQMWFNSEPHKANMESTLFNDHNLGIYIVKDPNNGYVIYGVNVFGNN